MSGTHISDALRLAVRTRDQFLCAYCKTAERIVVGDFTIDHVVPEAWGGPTELDNLCLACWRCNLIKGQRIVGADSVSGEAVRFFHPAQQSWPDHFAWSDSGLIVAGLTPTGRATIDGLKLNRPALVESRKLWMDAGWHPPNFDN